MVEHHTVSGHKSDTEDSQKLRTGSLNLMHQSRSKEPVLMSVYLVKIRMFSKWKLHA